MNQSFATNFTQAFQTQSTAQTTMPATSNAINNFNQGDPFALVNSTSNGSSLQSFGFGSFPQSSPSPPPPQTWGNTMNVPSGNTQSNILDLYNQGQKRNYDCLKNIPFT